jgi:hypothetical protein
VARAFNVCREGNRLVIRCDQLEGFISCAEPPDDPIAVERICDAMNTGFWLGYSLGETDAQANMRRALGLEIEPP